MAYLPQTAAPHTVSLGIEDNSIRALPIADATPAPDHLPVFYMLTAKGPEEAVVDGGRRVELFGLDSFKEGSKYFTHQTFGSNLTAIGANLQKIRRIKPDNAGSPANVIIYLDVLEKMVPLYERTADGALKRSATGNYIPLMDGATPRTVAGYQVAVVAKVDSSLNAHQSFGRREVQTGTTVSGSETSDLIPILEFKASSWGEVFNLSGIRISPVAAADVASRHTAAGQQLYKLSMVRKPDAKTSSKLVKSIYAAIDTMFSLDSNYKDPDTAASLSLVTAIGNWNNTTNLQLPYTVGDVAEVHVYKENIETTLTSLYMKEKAALATLNGANASWYGDTPVSSMSMDIPFSDTENDIYLINPFTSTNTLGKSYFAIQQATSVNVAGHTVGVTDAISVSQYTDIMLGGSSDGTITLEEYETKITSDVENYLDQNHIYQTPLLMEESVLYDTGFKFNNKLKLAAFIGAPLRKDLAFYASNYVYGEERLDEAVRIARTTTLTGVIRSYSESSYYGTPTARGWIVDGAGRPNAFNYSGRLPLTLDILVKNCAIFNASNKVWKQANIYDSYPSNKITAFYDLTTRFVPPATRNKLWNNGVTYPQAYSTTEDHFPGIRSIYSNDTSILTNSYAVWAAISLEKLGFKTHATFTGNVRYSNDQFIEAVQKYCESAINGRFAGLVTVVPKCVITEGDATLGYSWHLELHFSAENMKTAMVLSKHAYRSGDIPK